MTTVFLKADPKKKRSKYRNVTVKDPVDGHFHSKSEHARWKELKLLQRAGKIKGLERQVPYDLVVRGFHVATYVADFVYWQDNAGTTPWYFEVEDVKGGKAKTAAAQVFDLKRKLMKAIYQIDILVTGKGV